MLNEEAVINALRGVKYPGYSRDIVSFGIVKDVAAGNGAVSVVVQLTGGNLQIAQQIKADCESALRLLPEVQRIFVDVKLAPVNRLPRARTRGRSKTNSPASIASSRSPAARAA